MKADTVRILKPKITPINIDTGEKQDELKPGSKHRLDTVQGKHPHFPYYVLQGTRIGAISKFWEDKQKEGGVQLIMMAEDHDLRICGYRLPIRNVNLLNDWQKNHEVVGHLVKGLFLCTRCSLEEDLVKPAAIAVYPVNILPYSQNCQKCGLLLFDVWQAAKGGPLCLYK